MDENETADLQQAIDGAMPLVIENRDPPPITPAPSVVAVDRTDEPDPTQVAPMAPSSYTTPDGVYGVTSAGTIEVAGKLVLQVEIASEDEGEKLRRLITKSRAIEEMRAAGTLPAPSAPAPGLIERAEETIERFIAPRHPDDAVARCIEIIDNMHGSDDQRRKVVAELVQRFAS